MRIAISAQTVIDRPIHDVFDFVAVNHVENHARWDVEVSKIEPETSGPLGLGSRFRVVRRNFGREETRTMTVTEWQPPTRMTIATAVPGFELSLRGDFDAIGAKQTRHVLHGEGNIGGLRGLLVPLMKVKFRRDIAENLRRIKALVEAEPTG